MTPLVAGTPMACQNLSTGTLEHLSILYGFLDCGKDSELCRDRNREIAMKGVDYVRERPRYDRTMRNSLRVYIKSHSSCRYEP